MPKSPVGFVIAATGCLLVASSQGADTPSPRPWLEYRTIMWVGDSAARQPDKLSLFYQRLRDMGINAAMVYGGADPQPLLDHQFPYYVENMVNRGLCLKWNSKVTDWDKFVTTWAKEGRPESAFIRDYCLDDPEWRSWARREMQQAARKHRPHSPLAYDIRDELSTTISANPFDYDFNPIALAHFRQWLKTQYGDLPTLNGQWETDFASWEGVRPFSTDQVKHRMASGQAQPQGKPDWQALQQVRFRPEEARRQAARWNFSPWCDFRTYMDISLADALDDLRQAARAVDPLTPVGIEGTQMPHAFGGYDLWRLSQVLDWIEPYDIGNAREILGSFMPGKTIVSTVFEKDTNSARRRLWHLLLEGDRGCIVWWSEDCVDWKSAGYGLTQKARALAPVLRELTSPLGQLFLRAEKEHDPIAIHYSQASIQTDWLLESTVDGSTWHRRFSSFEADHNRMAKVRNGWLKAFQDLGYSPRFLSSVQIATGALKQRRFEALALPGSLALSAEEAGAIKRFLEPDVDSPTPKTLFADSSPGLFDSHGRLQQSDLLAGLLPATVDNQGCRAVQAGTFPAKSLPKDVAAFPKERLAAAAIDSLTEWIAAVLGDSPRLRRQVIVPIEARTRIHRYRVGAARLLAFERGIDYHMSEDLKQAGGNEALEKPVNLQARLAQPAHVYDLRTGNYLGQTDRISFRLDPWQPSLFALLPEKAAPTDLMDWLLSQTSTGPAAKPLVPLRADP
jgi:hypothetical protein